MIRISGSARRAFLFPAKLPIAYAYYGDVGRLLSYLPHIWLVRAYGPDRFRLLYSTTELGAYHIRIFADVQTTLDEGWVLRVHPLDGFRPVKSQAGARSSTTQGFFSSESFFKSRADQTQIEYSLQLHARLPTPYGLRSVPAGVVDRIANSITHMRTREIIEGFIDHSTAAFPHWLDEMENYGAVPGQGSVQSELRPDLDDPAEDP